MATRIKDSRIDTSVPSGRRRWREAVPNDRLAHVVKDLLRGMTRGMQIRLMDHAVSYGYWAFLRVLWEHDGITQRELSDYAGVTEPTTYSALRAMESLGYISRQKLPSNLRNVCILLTPEGRALKDKLIPLAEELNSVAVGGIAPRDVAIFRKTAITMMKNLEVDEFRMNRTLPPLRKVG
jgi:MarR family transcriptional regulator, organic hydroperoxide resistance regulator